jgi:hypothetical protein
VPRNQDAATDREPAGSPPGAKDPGGPDRPRARVRPLRRRAFSALGIAVLVALLAVAVSPGCGTTHPRRDPTGEPFPDVAGESLRGEAVALPAALRGAPALLLVGYEQSSQFDIDRWLLGLSDAGVDVAVREVPTLPGLAPRAFSGWIDSGMRSGIPEEDWGAVVTVYADASRIAEFTGNEEGLPARVLLLDAEGRVAFFHDRGYSVATLARLREVLAKLR